MRKLNELLNQEPEEIRSDCRVKNKIFDQVMGPEKPGRVRTFGTGPTPKQVFGSTSTSFQTNRPIEEIVRESVKETLTEEYLEKMREEIRQGINLDELREEVRGKLREEIGPELREKIGQELRHTIGQELRGEMQGMMQEMKSKFDQMRQDNIQNYAHESHSVPSNNKQVPDASSAHRLASNNDIGLLPLNHLQINNKLDRSHEIHQDKVRNKKHNEEITKKIQLSKKKKNKDEDRNPFINS